MISFNARLLESVDFESYIYGLESKYDSKIHSFEKNGIIQISLIVVPKDKRNSGVGTKIMNDFIKYADDHKLMISLTPTSDFGSSKSRLVMFYKKFGFVFNKGRNKDFEISDTMYKTYFMLI